MPPRTSLSHCLALLSEVTPPDVAILTQDLPVELIEQALAATGTATVRQRRMPAQQVVWLVLGLAMFRHLNIVQVVDQLGLAVQKGRSPVVPSAIHKARSRLGPLPIAWLFQATAQAWAHQSAAEHKFHGLSLYGVDGTTLRVPDSSENRAHFGGTNTHRGASGYPLCRLATLMALRSHLVAAAAFGPYATGEHGYAQQLWEQVPDHSLVALDRGFLAAVVLLGLQTRGNNRHYLIRLRKDSQVRVVKRLGPGDQLVELQVSRTAQGKHTDLPKTLVARRLVYQRKGYRPQALLTSLMDPTKTARIDFLNTAAMPIDWSPVPDPDAGARRVAGSAATGIKRGRVSSRRPSPGEERIDKGVSPPGSWTSRRFPWTSLGPVYCLVWVPALGGSSVKRGAVKTSPPPEPRAPRRAALGPQ